MVAGWFIGDLFKTVYFVVKAVPIQFILCGSVQLCVDVAICAQILVYPSSPQSTDATKGPFGVLKS